ncbi:hypothetical protein LTR17_016463 [Elasticomyces elasticus]|nr:hypothetical protein LTR17_016463 [Elasticomyces elasticus]
MTTPYTTARLEHATPAHLHATTRRTFIGPIPEGWLKSHRKQWYRHYITKPGGSKRAPTFTAQQSQSIPAPATEQTPRPSSQSAETGAGTSTTSLLHGQQRDDARSTRTEYVDALPSQTDGSTTLHVKPSKAINSVIVKTSTVRFADNTTTQQLRQRARRLASRGALTWSKVKDGEVLKMDRMLVRIDVTRQPVGKDFDEKVSAGVVTQPLDKWREYMVVCRRTQHAESDVGEAESVLQLYQTRVIAATAEEVGKSKKKPKHEIPLSLRQVGANMFSSLDKTLCIWTSLNGITTIYYLRPQSGAAAVDWFTFLRGVLGFKRARTLQVNVPDLSVSLRLDDPFRVAEATKLLTDAADGNTDALIKAVDAEKGAAGAIVARCLGMLEQSPEWKEILTTWYQNERIGLAWKRYDRLEWVYGAVEQRMYGTIAMAKTHDLELRPMRHYPVKTKTAEGEWMEEPSPVEGFLMRLTSQKGRVRMGKMMFKRLYFSTYDQYLFFSRPGNADPPPPPRLKLTDENGSAGAVPSAKDLTQQIPLNWDVEPYHLLDGGKGVEWLGTAQEARRDEEAEQEAERNVKIIRECDGFIDLCDVAKVRKMKRGAVEADEQLEEGGEVDFNATDATPAVVGGDTSKTDDGTTSEVDDARTFELVMGNGLVVRLQAYDEDAKKAWMKRLRELVKYWKVRAKADMDLFKLVRQQNLEALKIDERAEAAVGSFAQRWEISGHAVASPEMYNLCGIARCRTIHLAGLLFRKPRRHTTFTRCYVVLSGGYLLVFRESVRKGSGRRVEHVQHERIGSVDLKGCYLYSGLLTENDLLSRNRTFDANLPGAGHALPRVYLEDGWTSTDEDAMTTFVIWHAKSKSWFRSSQKVDDVRSDETAARRAEDSERGGIKGRGYKTKSKLTRVSQLGTTGRSVVFKARSRAERDHWVMALQVEIERLGFEEAAEKGEEVRLVGDE